jgi:SAM-dependent methyltransferase
MTADGSDRSSRDRALFDSIAEAYAGKDLLPAQRQARRERLMQTVSHLDLSRDSDIIELGCGAGFAAKYLKGQYRRYVGVDYSEQLIDFARRHNESADAKFFVGDITALGLEGRFDGAFMVGVLHHIHDPVEALRKTRSVLKPGARLAVNEPSKANPVVQAARWARTLTNKDYSNEQIQYGADQLRRQLLDAGFVDCEVFGQGLLSTPFAEVAMPMQAVMQPLSKGACMLDRTIEKMLPRLARSIAWNAVAVARNPT